MPASSVREPIITVDRLTMAFGDFVVQKDLNFSVNRGDIFVIMGGSGCGKSTLLRHMIGLQAPAAGKVCYGKESLWDTEPEDRLRILRRTGILYQSGALFTSMTLAENVGLPLQTYTQLGPAQIRDIVSTKLALVGLAGYEDFFPSAISGGMMKRAGLARAMALDPEILFFDEPSAGLDPITSKRLDDLILQLRDDIGSTIVMVTHELPSVFAIADNSVFLDNVKRTSTAVGDPKDMVRTTDDPMVREFLTREGTFHEAPPPVASPAGAAR
ncbi:MAG: ATP-binding cassette domain-containing protein [Rhodospirillales bacterium]